MAVFDQRNQTVTYQYNAAGDINLTQVTNRAEFATLLDRLVSEIDQAEKAGALDAKQAGGAKSMVQKATAEAGQAKPDKTKIADYINGAKSVVEGITAMDGLVTALVGAATLAITLF